MQSYSILFPKLEGAFSEQPQQPAFFPDVGLDQLIEVLLKERGQYDLREYFYHPLGEVESITYRQEVMRDLEDREVLDALRRFSSTISRVRQYLEGVETIGFKYHQQGCFLEASLEYIKACICLERELATLPLASRGLVLFREYLQRYIHSSHFSSLKDRALQIQEMLRRLRYCIKIAGNGFQVFPYEGQEEYTPYIEALFEKFWEEGEEREFFKLEETQRGYMNHIEEKILEFVARLFPRPFALLEDFFEEIDCLMDKTIERFDRELQFYLAYLEFMESLRKEGYSFCYPVVTSSKEVCVTGGYDVFLAHSLREKGENVVSNDFSLSGEERILVITGPNQGGKTTFARMVAQVHYLALLGLQVPATYARVFLCDKILTHFERRESLTNFQGKLEEELFRIYEILSTSTSRSLIILNELFSSTTLQDALFLNKEILTLISNQDAICVCVTFIEELSFLNKKTVSMVAQVEEHDPTIRTFKIIRQQANGMAYAFSLAHRHGLTYGQIKERIVR